MVITPEVMEERERVRGENEGGESERLKREASLMCL